MNNINWRWYAKKKKKNPENWFKHLDTLTLFAYHLFHHIFFMLTTNFKPPFYLLKLAIKKKSMLTNTDGEAEDFAPIVENQMERYFLTSFSYNLRKLKHLVQKKNELRIVFDCVEIRI